MSNGGNIPVKIREIAAAAAKFERVGAHAHIRGLGLDESGRAIRIADGLVGQVRAREAAGVVVRMIKEGRLSGRAIILAGPPGTGKTALAVAISKELGVNVPFIQMSGSEIYSAERKKTEVLVDAMRRCIGVEIREKREVFEGEVAKLEILTAPHPYNPYQRVPEGVRLVLRTTDEERKVEAGPEVAAEVLQLGIREGSVIQIDAETGRVSPLGVSDASERGKSYDIRKAVVPRPSGKVRKEKEFVYNVTLADMDEIAASRGGGSLASLLFGVPPLREISPEVRANVDAEVKKMVDEGRALIHPGVLFIDDAHMLDVEAFSFLSRALEGDLVPIIILATNRGRTRIRGTDVEAPLGIPLDMLDRAVIIGTEEYSREDIADILKIRAEAEGAKLEADALEKLADIGARTSLRYASQLLSVSTQIARAAGREAVGAADVERAASLFMDISQAVEHLKKYEEKLLR
ncbi:MAG: RuvB-like domain-containing protein [Conexivisphaera sp.]